MATIRTPARTRPASVQPFDAALSLTLDRLIIALDAQPRPLRWASLRVQKRWAERRVPAFGNQVTR